MIESFNVPVKNVSKWAGFSSTAFSLSQAITGVFWGRGSDYWGRKPMILAGLCSALVASLLFGFSTSLWMAIAARSLAGAASGNVGIMRTVIAELVPQKELQPRAFSILPTVYTVGGIFGPGLGGILANPAKAYPKTFGNSVFFQAFPYALPNIVTGIFFIISILIGFLFLNVSESSEIMQLKAIFDIIRKPSTTKRMNEIMVEVSGDFYLELSNPPKQGPRNYLTMMKQLLS